jgi:uncharacterized damage-inducible protein DinB
MGGWGAAFQLVAKAGMRQLGSLQQLVDDRARTAAMGFSCHSVIHHRTSTTIGARELISAGYCRLMARYNTWQNTSLVTAADGLTNVDRWKDRGAFFQSIAATLNHLYWADALILQRLKGNERPEENIKHSLTSPSDWDDFKTLRLQRNEEIEEWAARLLDADLNGMVVWYLGGGPTRIEKATALCVIELFNHQTHHRGQVHAMLTAAGAEPEPTDLSMLA